ncbi:unnamed protein product [Prorocentrum cordatum]|uniref:Uncharacterized protein n=1 Tax=Prorocentrum cordatum TaxID=2364126 RepID=A0ABN9S5F5_9DINO|nr:unnamed protein product [Polarella glacialis]
MDSDSRSGSSEDEDYSSKAEGIVMRRRCTDVGSLLMFAAFLWCHGYVAVGGFREGNLDKLTRGLDWRGQLCGVGPDVAGNRCCTGAATGRRAPSGWAGSLVSPPRSPCPSP